MSKRIGLIDVDGKGTFPSIPLMKISAYHKSCGDLVDWYYPFNGKYDKVYLSKVFSFSQDYINCIDADEIVRGGTGYSIRLVNGREVYDKSKDKDLPNDVEHIYPDYSLYAELTNDTAFGFLTRGCPRGCNFCVIKNKEGITSHKTANLSEFYRGQKNIVLCDANILACRDWKDLLQQLIDSKANIDFNQGLDIRLMTKEKAEMLSRVKVKEIHFAWDKYEDKDVIIPKLKMYAEITKQKPHSHNAIVYTITNFNTSIEQDLERIYTLRDIGYWPYVMIYDKEHCNTIYKKLQRWVNNRFIFAKCEKFEDYGKLQIDETKILL